MPELLANAGPLLMCLGIAYLLLFLSKAGFTAEARPGDVIRFTFDLEVDE